jgi:hypothetical protein
VRMRAWAEAGSVGQRPGEPEEWQRAVVEEPGHRADLAAGQGEHEDACGVGDRGVRVADVEAERGLAVGPGRHQPGLAPGPERSRGPEPGGQLVALVPQRERRHDQPGVLGEQGDKLIHVTCFVGPGEPSHQRPLAVTGFTSALTDIPLIALVQQRIPDRHLAKALGLWEAGIAGAIAIAPVIATAIIDTVGVSTGFMLSGAALAVIGLAGALALNRTKGRGPAVGPGGPPGHVAGTGFRAGPDRSTRFAEEDLDVAMRS